MPTIRTFTELDAWRSARELTKLVYSATRADAFSKVSQAEFERLIAAAEKTVNLIGGLMKYLQQSTIKGTKYKR